MHSHDRTLIASLGFADPDKKNPMHDLACQYLTDEEVAGMMADHFSAPRRVERTGRRGYTHIDPRSKRRESGAWPTRYAAKFSETLEIMPALEQTITKGEGKYRVVVGFLDVVIGYDIIETRVGEVLRYEGQRPRREDLADQTAWLPYEETITHSERLVIEVKIAPPTLGDALRQIQFYREFLTKDDSERDTWILATPADLSADVKARLAGEQVEVVKLGTKFTDWVRLRQYQQPPPGTPPTLEV